MMPEELRILGVKVHKIDTEETISRIESFIREKKPSLVVTLGTEMVMKARKDREFLDVLNAADLVCADTVGIVWASKIIGNALKEKVAGVDILARIAKLSEERGWKLYFLGAAEGVAEAAAKALQRDSPGMHIVGVHHGYFDDEATMVEKIKEASPDILLTALGSPRQELFIYRNRERLGVPVGIGIGGSFDVISGKLKRSPQWMINLGLEWLYRLYLEPWRWKRMTVLPVFAIHVILAKLMKR